MARIGVAGANGRMGRAIAREVLGRDGVELTAVWERPGALGVGARWAGAPLVLGAGPEGLENEIDVAIDFTHRVATVRHAAWCAQHGVALVVGTTGLTDDDHAALDEAAKTAAIVQSPNMSVGVNALFVLVEQAAAMLGADFDLEIVETHHRHKKDAPSGTALRLLEGLQRARPGATGVFERHGDIGARTAEEIGVQTLRGGDVVGEHTVFYFGDGERLELTHRATDRGIFAAGAVRAASWATSQPPGRYTMQDVLSRPVAHQPG